MPSTLAASPRPWLIEGAAALCLVAVWVYIFVPRLGKIPLQPGDEARVAVNALEMVMHGQPLVTHYDGTPEYHNLKPPLLVWLMALFLPLFDNPLVAIRLPTALACLGTVLLVLRVSSIYLRDQAAGLFAGLVLLTSWGFTGLHTGATGDYDALLTLCIAAYAFTFFLMLEAETRPPSRQVWLFGLFVLMALMTKGIAGAIALPALPLYAVWRGRLGSVLVDWRVWAAALAVAALVAGYICFREWAAPGYVTAMLNGDIIGLAAGRNLVNYSPPWHYYLLFIFGLIYSTWFLPLPLLAVLIWIGKNERARRLSGYCAAIGLWIFVVIDSMGTKFFWYFAPIMPFFAMIVGMGLSQIRLILARGSPLVSDLAFLGLMTVAVIWHKGVDPIQPFIRVDPPQDRQLRYGGFLPLLRSIDSDRPLSVADSGIDNLSGLRHWNPLALFHVEVETWRGRPTAILPIGARPGKGDLVASCDVVSIRWLESEFQLNKRLESDDCLAAEIMGPTKATATGAP